MANSTPLSVANFFIKKAVSENEAVNHLKLQKLVYCAHGWHLSSNNMPLIVGNFYAWKHGPVMPSLFHILKPYGLSTINEPQSSSPTETPPEIQDEKLLGFLTWVWNRYKKLDGFQLSDLTHKPGTPWHTIVEKQGYPPPMDTVIPDNLIQAEFTQLHKEMTNA